MSKQSQPRGPKQAQQPVRVNWWVIAGAIVVVGVIAFISINQSKLAETETSAPAGVVSSGVSSWSEPPAMEIDTNKTYTATLETEIGDIKVVLFDDLAQVTVNNFVFLARQGFYNNTIFHRVIPGFMAQAGDPTGTGSGGPGYTFEDEVNTGETFDRAGLLAMANRGPATNGSQFFITYVPTPHLNELHTIFGEVIDGMDVALALSIRDPQAATIPGTGLLVVRIDEQ